MHGASTLLCSPEQLLQYLPHMVWTSRPDGFTNFINQYGLTYLGVDLESFQGWGWLRCVHPADVARSLESWSDSTSSGQPYDIEYRMRTASGEYRWQHSKAEPVRDKDGTIQCWIGSTVETERWKLHEQYLRSANRQIDETVTVLSLLENHSPVGFALVDSNFRFTRVNEAFAEITGLPRSNHLGQTVESVLPHLWQKLCPFPETVLQTQQPILNCEIAGETPSQPGELRHWLLSYHPVVLDDDVLGIGIIMREITDQKQVEQQLHDLLAMREDEA